MEYLLLLNIDEEYFLLLLMRETAISSLQRQGRSRDDLAVLCVRMCIALG